jgi:hypothetical protein
MGNALGLGFQLGTENLLLFALVQIIFARDQEDME